MKRIAIVGGGITGLTAAHDLERQTDAEIDLYEASNRLGGKLQTASVGPLVVEQGPDCFFSRKPGVLELIRELGLEHELIAPKAGEFSMFVGGSLHRVPRGLVALNAPDPASIREASFLDEPTKARALAPEPIPGTEDLSIREFFGRRYGAEFSRLVAEPLLASTHGGDPTRLSMRALYPAYLSPSPPTPPLPVVERGALETATFLSFRNGMSTLIEGLAKSLSRTRIHLRTQLVGLPQADRTLLAVPANRASKLLPGIGLEAIPHRSSAITTLAFERKAFGRPLQGTGFLVPSGEAAPLSGATWSSEKWEARAPEDQVLLRVFQRNGEQAFLPFLRDLLSITDEPIYVRQDRWTDALPQYELGHLPRVEAIEAALPPGVFVAGTSYRGVGVPDSLRQGREAARRIAQSL